MTWQTKTGSDHDPMDEQTREVMAQADAEQSLREEGFLSGWIDRFVPHYRDQNRAWVDYSRDLNRLAHTMWFAKDDLVVGKSSLDPICISSRLFLRALSAFQGALVLADRGMTTEADSLTRGVYECGFWLGYFQANPEDAAAALLADERASQAATVKSLRKRASLAEHRLLDEKMAELGGAKRISMEDVAGKSGFPGHYASYKELSAASVHTSLHSLHRHMKPHGDGSFDGHVMGPDADGIKASISAACHALALCVAAFSMGVGGTEQDDEFRVLLKRFVDLGSSTHGGGEVGLGGCESS